MIIPLPHFRGISKGQFQMTKKLGRYGMAPWIPREELRALVVRGENGLLNLCNLLEYLACDHGIPGVLLEGKVGRIMQAIDEV